MGRALAAARAVRCTTAPNPWVGAVVATSEGRIFTGATQPEHGQHAEAMALAAAGDAAQGATLFVTLEPCNHRGHNPACVDAILEAKVARVVVAMIDPDERMRSAGVRRLRHGGVTVDVGLRQDEAEALLEPYVKHRLTGRPYVVLKMAATLDGRTAAPDGSSKWITGPEARVDVHRIRNESDVIVVGAGTVRADNPSLTIRDVPSTRQPRRIVLGAIPKGAAVLPAESWTGPIDQLLDRLGNEGVLQVMVEGGATVARAFHQAGLIDEYVTYVAPALLGGDDGVALMQGPGAPTMADVWRGKLTDVTRFGNDIRLTMKPQ